MFHPRSPLVAPLLGAALLLGAFLPAQGQTPPSKAADLFRAVGPEFDLTPEQQQTLTALREDASTGAIQILQINLNVPKTADAVNFNLVPGATMMLSTRSREDRTANDYSWSGGDPSGGKSAVLVVRDQKVTGTIRDGDKLFRVRPLGQGVHAVIEVNQEKLPPDHPPAYQKLEGKHEDAPPSGSQRGDGSGVMPASNSTSAAEDAPGAGACGTIDVLVAYTARAAQQAGDIAGLIQLAIDETNISYEKSEIKPRLRLVHQYQTPYTELGAMETDIERFARPSDSFADEVHGKRDQYGADLALLITGNGNYCGIAHAIGAAADSAFAVVGQNCATGYYSFGHEIGHLQGARHNPEADNSTLPFPYGHGFISPPTRKRTIMAYDCPNGCQRIDVWANPNLIVDGVPMGTPDECHDVRVLNETACEIAGFRGQSSGTSGGGTSGSSSPPTPRVPAISGWSLLVLLALAPLALRRPVHS